MAAPKTLPTRLFATAARYVRTTHTRVIDLDPDWPWTHVLSDAFKQLAWLGRLALP